MSGSPVYLDGKLAGALSLKLGIFTKDPIAGVTPIADVVRLQHRAALSNSLFRSTLPPCKKRLRPFQFR